MWGSGEAFLCDLCRSRTSIFEVFAILGYVFHFCFHYMLHLQLFYFFRTPIFHFSLFSGYISVFLIHYVSYFPCFLVVAYPTISFLTFFGVHFCLPHTLCFIFFLLFSGCVPRYFIFNFSRGTRLLVHHLLCLQHTPLCPKRTTIFHFLYFSGYAPPHTSLIVTSAHSYSPKTYPAISFLTFLWVRYSIA